MQRYQYQQLCVELAEMAAPSFEEKLTALGHEGWLLVGTVQRERHGYSREARLIFSRPAEGDAQ